MSHAGDVARSLTSVLKLAVAANQARVARRPVAGAEEIAFILRTVYSGLNGIPQVLNNIVRQQIDLEPIGRLNNLDHMQTIIEDRLRRLDLERVGADLLLDHETIRTLRSMADGTLSLRAAIVYLIHELEVQNLKPYNWQQELQWIIGRIEELNAQIRIGDPAIIPRSLADSVPLSLADRKLKEFEEALDTLKTRQDFDAIHPVLRDALLIELGSFFAEIRGTDNIVATPHDAVEYIKDMNSQRREALFRLVRDNLDVGAMTALGAQK